MRAGSGRRSPWATGVKEGPALIILGVVLLLMLISSIFRMRAIRSDAVSARTSQKAVVPVPPHDPARFASLNIVAHGGDPAPMVYIEGGAVTRGTEDETGEFDERPVRTITLLPYWIDLKEVSNAQYQKYVKMTKRPAQEVMVFYDDVSYLYGPTLPAVGVSWSDAEAYCSWNGKRLPTEAEWEYAARGADSDPWPWGGAFKEGYANVRGGEDGFAYSAPVDAFEAGRSDFGLYQTAGNVAEWVSDWYDEFFYKDGQVTLPRGPDDGKVKVIRGGSWDSIPNDTRVTKRNAVAPHRKEATVGFRCVMDPGRE